jgi:hypothetical protein
MARLAVAAAGVIVLLGLPVVLCAQARLAGADLQGAVTDDSGGLLADAAVTVVNMETSVARKIETDSRGRFHVLGLPPGTYQVTVVRHGFRTQARDGVVLLLGNRRHSTSRCRWRSPVTK